MRFHLPATAASLCLVLLSMSLAATEPKPPAAAPPSPSSAAANSDRFAAEAAARHAKRTQCLQQAKTKKLVGAGKDAYVKECLDAH